MSFIIPPINTKGLFVFASPFDKTDKLSQTEELTVVSVRNLIELYNSNEDPFGTIYTPFGLTKKEYDDDVNAEVPVIVFKRTNGDYYYVPANKVSSYPTLTGVKYRGEVLAFNLGSLPLDTDFTTLLSVAADVVYEVLGVKTIGSIIHNSAISYVTEEEHAKYEKLRANKKTVDKSNLSLYTNAVERIKTLEATLAAYDKHLIEQNKPA